MRNALSPHSRPLREASPLVWEASPLGDRTAENLRPETGLPHCRSTRCVEEAPCRALTPIRVEETVVDRSAGRPCWGWPSVSGRLPTYTALNLNPFFAATGRRQYPPPAPESRRHPGAIQPPAPAIAAGGRSYGVCGCMRGPSCGSVNVSFRVVWGGTRVSPPSGRCSGRNRGEHS